MKKKTLLTLLGGMLIGFSACTTDINLAEISSEVGYGTALVIPVGTAHTTVSQLLDVINSGVMRQDSDMNTCFLYVDQDININTDSVKVGDFTKSKVTNSTTVISEHMPEYSYPRYMSSCVESDNVGYTDESDLIDFDYNHTKSTGEVDQRVDSIDIKQADLSLSISGTDLAFDNDNYLIINVTFPGVEDIAPRRYVVKQLPTNLKDVVYDFKVRFSGTDTKAKIKVKYTFVSNGSLYVKETSAVHIDAQFRMIDYNMAWGYFGRDEIITKDDIDQKIPTDFFTNSVMSDTNNHILFYNPRIRFDITSNVGFPMDFSVLGIRAEDDQGRSREASFVEGGASSKSCVIKLQKPKNECDTSVNTRVFDNQDGHTERLFEINPKRFVYQFQVQRSQLDPSNPWEWQHYLCNPPTIFMKVTAELPFQFRKNTLYQHHDTLPCDLEELTNMNGIPDEFSVDNLNINLHYISRLPAKAKVNVVLLDENDAPVYSKDFPAVIAAPVDAEGRTTGVAEGDFRMEFVNDDIAAIWKMKKCVVTVVVDANDPENDMIYFSLDDELTVQASLFVKASVKTDLDTIRNIKF